MMPPNRRLSYRFLLSRGPHTSWSLDVKQEGAGESSGHSRSVIFQPTGARKERTDRVVPAGRD